MPNKTFQVGRIISGGQTGVDRAALDVAMDFGFAIGGAIPLDRWAEDGTISKRYVGLEECDSADPAVRTRLNVLNSDATLIISHGKLAGGSALTSRIARDHQKALLHIDLGKMSVEAGAEKVRLWLETIAVRDLNVAGPRASKDPEIYQDAVGLLKRVFSCDV